MMDNFMVDITSEGKKQFQIAMSLFAEQHKKVTRFRTVGNRMILYWTDSEKATPLPYEMTIEQAVEFAWGWLEQAELGPEPDHDGSNGKGWRIYNESWGHVDNEWQAFVAIEPAWAMYGK